jgi:hypothetical protein
MQRLETGSADRRKMFNSEVVLGLSLPGNNSVQFSEFGQLFGNCQQGNISGTSHRIGRKIPYFTAL